MQGRVPEGLLEAEFQAATGWSLSPRVANPLEAGVMRQDTVFQGLAAWAFDHPEALADLRRRAGEWVRRWPEPRTWELSGYLEYLAADWAAAARAFMASLEQEPENLDAWVDLAFCLKHLGLALGESILFDYDLWIRLQCQERGPLTLASLNRLHGRVQQSPDRLEVTSVRWVAPYLDPAS
ncbi:MAG: hypothetical protein ACOX9B_07930 [Candidatus Xenobium sp.]|jgi:hypothetical protein|nr:hypothetical protein [Burkholderiales bacterium]